MAETPLVSIIILNYHHPEIIEVCLRQLHKHTFMFDHEVIVVDNGSTEDELAVVRGIETIDKLIENGYNALFSKGNNIGVAHANPDSKYLLFMNSDVAVIHDEWLSRLLDWMEGDAEFRPAIWASNPTQPKNRPLDILSAGWSHDVNIPGKARPEGFCLMIRHNKWRPFDEDFPWYYGWEHTVSQMLRDGCTCGVLWNYSKYLIHREQGSGRPDEYTDAGPANFAEWFSGLEIETLDFTIGPNEHSSYLDW